MLHCMCLCLKFCLDMWIIYAHRISAYIVCVECGSKIVHLHAYIHRTCVPYVHECICYVHICVCVCRSCRIHRERVHVWESPSDRAVRWSVLKERPALESDWESRSVLQADGTSCPPLSLYSCKGVTACHLWHMLEKAPFVFASLAMWVLALDTKTRKELNVS